MERKIVVVVRKEEEEDEYTKIICNDS